MNVWAVCMPEGWPIFTAVVADISGTAEEGRLGLWRTEFSPLGGLQLWLLRNRNWRRFFFWQKSNYLETRTAVLSGLSRCVLGSEISHFVSSLSSLALPWPKLFLEIFLSNHKPIWIEKCSKLFKGWWDDCAAKKDCFWCKVNSSRGVGSAGVNIAWAAGGWTWAFSPGDLCWPACVLTMGVLCLPPTPTLRNTCIIKYFEGSYQGYLML